MMSEGMIVNPLITGGIFTQVNNTLTGPQGEFNCMTWLYLSKLTMDLGLKALISSEPTQLLGPFITLQKDMISQNAIPTHA